MSAEALDGSVFLPLISSDAAARSLTVSLGEDAAADGRRLDYAASRSRALGLKGRDVYVLGKAASVGRVVGVEARDSAKRAFLELQITDEAAWSKIRHGVYKGAQARTYEVHGLAKRSDRYGADFGALQLVDRPFEQASALRKSADLSARAADVCIRADAVIDKFETAVSRCALALGMAPLAKSTSPSAATGLLREILAEMSSQLATFKAQDESRSARIAGRLH